MQLQDVMAALMRARTLITDLDRSDRDTDRHQVAAGVRHELDTALRGLNARLEAEQAEVGAARPGKVRRDASATSRAAAEAIAPRRGSQAWRVLEMIAAHPTGLTDHSIQVLTGLGPSSERPRRGELVDAGLVRNSGNTQLVNGAAWAVWEVTDKGREVVRAESGRYVPPPLLTRQQGELF